MATGYAAEMVGILDGTDPGKKTNGAAYNAPLRRERATLDLSSADVKKAQADINYLFRVPRGAVVDHIRVVSSVSLTTSQLAFGVTGATAKYGAAKVYGTTAKAPIDWYEPTLMDDAPLAASEDVFVTISAADLPGAGIVIVDVFYSARG